MKTQGKAQQRILVVDDDPMTLDICSTYLSHANYDVTVVPDAGQAYARLGEKPFDLLVLDVHMPNEDGLSFLKRVREHWPDLPTVLITGYPALQTVVNALQLNVLGYLIKPFRPRDLLDMIEKNLPVPNN